MGKLLQAIRAKSKESGIDLPLINHIKETLGRAIKLMEFIERNKSSFTYEHFTEDNKRKEFFKNLFKALFLHDFGKINYKFQKEVYSPEERERIIQKKGFKNSLWNEIEEFFKSENRNENKEDKIDYRKIDLPDHEVVSLLYTFFFLNNTEQDKKIKTAILLHHYNSFYTQNISNIRLLFSTYPDLEKYLKFLIKNTDKVKEFLKNLIEELIKDFGNNEIKTILEEFKEKLDSQEIKKRLENLNEAIQRGYGVSKIVSLYKVPEKDLSKEWYDFFVFLGALRRCDYSASGNVDIEMDINLKKECYKDLLNKIKTSIGKREDEKIWQEKILEEKYSDNLILIAPTGSGKTEFALLWAARREKKLIYTLPLRVALNDLFCRFKSEDEREAYFDENFVNILHSTSFIEYLKGENEGKDVDVGAKVSGTKILSSPLLLTTPDQVFLSSLKYYGFDKLLSIYPLSAIVIDEIQAYNPEMAAVIIKTLEMIRKLHGNLLIITATFPPYFEEFLKEYHQLDLKEIIKEKIISEDEIKNYSVKRHKTKLIDKSLFDYEPTLTPKKEGFEEIKNLIKNNPNKNIMILVNNVGKAIEVYKLLTQYYKNSKNKEGKKRKEIQELFMDLELENIELLHSRMIEKEKSERIARIKKTIEELENKRKNKEKIEPKDRAILVTTQIVEASVDVDFDILITEISPIDSQIQRWGRVWRNRKDEERKQIEYSEKKENIYIFSGEKNEGEIKIDRGTTAIYNKQVILKTIDELRKKEGQLLSYKEERDLVDSVYKDDLLEYYKNEINKNLEWLKFYSAEKRSEAQRIFRNIAGIQVFVPNLPGEDDEIYRELCNILKDEKNWEFPLTSNDPNKDSIAKLMKDKIKNKKLKNNEGNLKWKILETLYKYSFNLPIFGLENNIIRHKGLERASFKGFFILNVKDEKLKEIKEFGIPSIKDIDIDDQLIKQNETDQNIL